VNVYDFDGTIYAGDSTFDFWLYCIRKYPASLRTLPGTLSGFLRYKTGKYGLETFKENFYRFVRFIPSAEDTVKSFWDTHLHKIQKWYLEQKNEDDVIISASPEFLLAECCRRLGVTLIASRVDSTTGKLLGHNCKGGEKVRRFREAYPNSIVENFYSDSKSDKPMAKLAKCSYLVKGSKLKEGID